MSTGRCCPGGFSSYILHANRRTIGTGLSLEVAKGGHELLLEPAMLSRFELIWGDVNSYQLGPDHIYHHDAPFVPFPITPATHPAGFSLVLLDGHPLRTAVASGMGARDALHTVGDRLLISQLIIGLTTVNLGGTIVIKLSRPDRLLTAQVMWMFDKLAAVVGTWKPVCIHATRETFYLIARGMGYGELAAAYGGILRGLKILWTALTRTKRRLREDDLDFIVSATTLGGSYMPRLQKLSAHIWAVQKAATEGWYQQMEQGF